MCCSLIILQNCFLTHVQRLIAHPPKHQNPHSLSLSLSLSHTHTHTHILRGETEHKDGYSFVVPTALRGEVFASTKRSNKTNFALPFFDFVLIWPFQPLKPFTHFPLSGDDTQIISFDHIQLTLLIPYWIVRRHIASGCTKGRPKR